MEASGKHRTRQVLRSLRKLLPESVSIATDCRDAATGEVNAWKLNARTIARDEVRVGDIVRVAPGERIPIDGVVRLGEADVDEQILTGESRPVRKGAGDTLHAGSLCLDQELWFETSTTPNSDFVHRMLQAVEEGRGGTQPQ